MGKKVDFEYIVIGSGPAGSAAALTLAKAKKRVAIVEASKFGGSNLNSRDIPYGVGLGFSHLYSAATSGSKFGLSNINLHFNFPTVIAWQECVIKNVGGDDRKVFEDAGITCINGHANLLDENTVAVGDKQFTATKIILATGSRLNTGEISGADTVNYLTPETAIKVRRVPKAVAVVGGGSTGCEIAEYFAELGTKVLILERSERLLPREDKEVSEAVAHYFSNHLNVIVLPNAKVVALEQDDLSKRVIFSHDGREKMVRVDTIVLATGSKPVTDYGLENARVNYKNAGIVVDKNFQTSAKNIFAIGDALGGESSTDYANYQGLLLATNLISKSKNIPNYAGFARVIKTMPSVATVGYNEDDLLKRDKKYNKSIVFLSEIMASKINDFNDGFVKLLSDTNGHIIGATIVSPNAEELISELAIAVRHNLTALDIASTPHLYDNFGLAIKIAATRLVNNKKK